MNVLIDVNVALDVISPYQVTANHWPPDSLNLAFERQYSDRLLAKTACGQYIS